MQYIQFQPQIGSQVPTPTTGNISVFVDVTDNTLKAKDDNGDIVSGSGGINVLDVSKAQMDIYISAASLTTGQYYKITGVDTSLFGGTDIILQATSSSQLSKQGLGYFYNPKYRNPSTTATTGYYIWNNVDRISISGITGNFIPDEVIKGDQGQLGNLVGSPGATTLNFVNTGANWTTTINVTGQSSGAIAAYAGYISTATYTVGNKVIWGGYVWLNLSSNVGQTASLTWPASQVGLDGANWSVVPYNTTDYDLTTDTIEFDYSNNNINLRKSKTNEVRSDNKWFTSSWGYNNINRLPWGHPNVNDVRISNAYLEGVVNFPNRSGNTITNISVDNGGGFSAHYWGWGTQISGITADKGGQFATMNFGDNARVSNITIGQGGSCNDWYTSNNDTLSDQFKNISAGITSKVDHIFLYPTSYLKNIKADLTSSMSYNYLYSGSDIYNVTLVNGAIFSNVTLFSNSEMYFIDCGGNSTVQNILGDHFTSSHNIKIGDGAYFGDISFLAPHNEIGNVTLNNGSYFQNIFFNDSFSNVMFVNLGIDAGFSENNLGNTSLVNYLDVGNNSFVNNLDIGDGSILEYVNVTVNANINNLTINDSFTLANIKVDVGTSFSNATFAHSVASGYISLESSTFPATLDITGLGSINLNTVNYAGIINLTSSNSSESVALLLSGATSFTQKLQPATGLTVTFLGTPISGVTQNGMMIMPTTSYVAHGKSYDYITFDTVSDGLFTVARQRGGNKYL